MSLNSVNPFGGKNFVIVLNLIAMAKKFTFAFNFALSKIFTRIYAVCVIILEQCLCVVVYNQ